MSESRTRRTPRVPEIVAPSVSETIAPPAIESSDISPIALAATEAATAVPQVERVAEQVAQAAETASDAADQISLVTAETIEQISSATAQRAEQITAATAQTAEQITAATAQSAEQVSASASKTVESTAKNLYSFGDETMSAFAASQAAIVRGFEAMATEMAGLAHSGFTAVADSATALLGAKTLADAIEVQAGFARRSVDAAIDSSAKLSEIGVRLTTEASQPLISRLGETWKITRLG